MRRVVVEVSEAGDIELEGAGDFLELLKMEETYKTILTCASVKMASIS